ncbi:SMa0974 family conjugal transfer regulator [Ensifer sesbaniae]|uniref:SMa0974 family conjugal transfer regulator n=1 Tax=Ensifer sesbaniae TaxID=1214071 RepID=UPI003D7F3421|nr:hypothetical protein [Ensifer sesbaniae]
MYKHTAEAFVPVQHAVKVTQKVCARYGDYCRSIAATGVDRLLDFGDARAILRPTDEGLHFRIDAQDAITFYGIWTFLHGSLSTVTTFSDVGGPVSLSARCEDPSQAGRTGRSRGSPPAGPEEPRS